jgi:hypothetical protein
MYMNMQKQKQILKIGPCENCHKWQKLVCLTGYGSSTTNVCVWCNKKLNSLYSQILEVQGYYEDY